MRNLLFIAGIIILLISIAYLYFPGLVLKINLWMRSVIFDDDKVIYNRKKIGLVLSVISCIIIFISGELKIINIDGYSIKETNRKKLFQAYKNYYSGKYLKTISLCEDILQKEPKNFRSMELLAVTYNTMGEKNKAIIYIKKIKSSNIKSKINEGIKIKDDEKNIRKN